MESEPDPVFEKRFQSQLPQKVNLTTLPVQRVGGILAHCDPEALKAEKQERNWDAATEHRLISQLMESEPDPIFVRAISSRCRFLAVDSCPRVAPGASLDAAGQWNFPVLVPVTLRKLAACAHSIHGPIVFICAGKRMVDGGCPTDHLKALV